MSTGTEATSGTSLPVSKPYQSTFVRRTIQLQSRVYGRFKQSERKPINDKGYLFSLLIKSNPQIGGGMNSGDIMLVGGSDEYITLMVGTSVKNGARAWNGGNIRQMNDANYFGLSRTQQEVLDAERFANEQDKDICFSGITMSRGVISVIPTYDAGANESTVTFVSSKNGSYYLREMEGRKFLVHHPTTFAAKGGTTPFELKRVPTATTAVFAGDMTGGTAIAANDIIVPIGTADNHSSVNKGLRNLEYMTQVTGEYYTASVTNNSKLKAIQYDLAGNEVTRAVLEYVDSLYSLNYPGDPMGNRNHTDVISPTQKAKFLFQAEGQIRINTTDGSVANYNPKINFKGWNGRDLLEDPYILPTNWFIFDFRNAERGVQKEWGTWDYDNQEYRAIPSNGSIRDAIQKHWISVEAVWHTDPRQNVLILNAATAGAATPVNI